MPPHSPNHAVGRRICGSGLTKSRGGIRTLARQHNLILKCSTDTMLVCRLTPIMYHPCTSVRSLGSVNSLVRNRFSGCLMVVALRPPVWMGCRTGIYVLRHPLYHPLWHTCLTCRSVSRMFHLSGGSVSSRLFLRFPRPHHAPTSDQWQSHPYCLAFLRGLWYDPFSTLCWSTRIPIIYSWINLLLGPRDPPLPLSYAFFIASLNCCWPTLCTPDSFGLFQGSRYCPPFYHDGEILKFPHTGQRVQLGCKLFIWPLSPHQIQWHSLCDRFHFCKHRAGFGSRSLFLRYGGLGPTTSGSH